MATIEQVYNNVNKLNLAAECRSIINNHKDDLLSANRRQMLAGKDAYGLYLPRYVDDPYFKSFKSAIAYQNWKAKISPDKSKPKDVMDFFIVGVYHSSLRLVAIVKGGFKVESNASFKDSIDRKTGGAHKGLNNESIKKVKDDFFEEELMKRVHEVTKL